MPRNPKWSIRQHGAPADPRAALKDLADRLSRSGIKNAKWLADAIERWLAGDPKTLDQALCVRTRGPKRKPASPEELAWGKRAFFLHELERLSWHDVCDRLQIEQDESTLRQKYLRIRADVVRALADSGPLDL
jgi:hypothetical protein